ncbi:MAG: filamentous hemagglutinin N-terminal domain-containing protein, partial [Verrucomicrobiales bacterium]|nr:filamentous hemagglutinin N-terminal domain-containing protein [Verrucomicrobiales bacterium]
MGTNNCSPPRAVLLALLVGLAPSLAGAQPVVPDGSTATTVGMNAGKTTVHIAPVTSSGLSHNRYARFDVPAAGVDLDNRAAGAQTIINEVTGNQRSLLAGPLTVLGARAQVLIANPNGIKVDGGSFHNTGGLALTTGSVGFADRQVTPFLTQRNALVTTADGAIEIGPGGLSGLFTHLVLAARQLTVNGPVTNANADRDATLQLIAGGSELEFDSSVLPGSLSKPWLQAAPRDAGATTALLVDITRPASLSASNIQIAVTARGAGVRLASAALATAGDFYLASNGEVRLTGGHIDAAGNIRVEKQSAAEPAPTVIAADDGERGFALTAGGQLEILADHINLTRGRLATDAGDIVLGCKDGNATGDFRFVGVDAEDGITAGGGIGLYAQGQDMYLAALTVTAASAVEIMANKF